MRAFEVVTVNGAFGTTRAGRRFSAKSFFGGVKRTDSVKPFAVSCQFQKMVSVGKNPKINPPKKWKCFTALIEKGGVFQNLPGFDWNNDSKVWKKPNKAQNQNKTFSLTPDRIFFQLLICWKFHKRSILITKPAFFPLQFFRPASEPKSPLFTQK